MLFVVVVLQVSGQDNIQVYLNDPLKYKAPLDECTSEICVPLLKMINGAKKSIDFAIYGMRNQSGIMKALVKAKQRGVVVRGIVDKDVNNTNYYTSTEELIRVVRDIKTDFESDVEYGKRKRKIFDFACKRPIGFKGPVQCVGYSLKGNKCIVASHASKEEIVYPGRIMHHKFFVVDGREVWTGSTNISSSGIGGYNANIAIVVRDKQIAKWYSEEFEQMYLGDFHQSKRKFKDEVLQTTISGTNVKLSFSPQGNTIDSLVSDLIKEAKEYIDLPIFFLTHKKLAGDLIDAYYRGVKVRVIIDATASKNGYTKHEILRAVGIPVKVENWGGKMHMKACVIDGKYLIAGSMNWTVAGDKENDENTLIIKSSKLANKVHRFFNKLWVSIDNKWLTNRPDPESLNSGTSCFDGIDNDFDGLVDKDDEGCGSNPPRLDALPPYRIVSKSNGYGLVKGNINKKGVKIYHVYGSKWYDKTKIDTRRGERFFCSIQEAKSSGWRRSRGR